MYLQQKNLQNPLQRSIVPYYSYVTPQPRQAGQERLELAAVAYPEVGGHNTEGVEAVSQEGYLGVSSEAQWGDPKAHHGDKVLEGLRR